MTITTGDCVTITELPEWVEALPPESRQVFQYCLGRAYPVVEIDDDRLYVLDVSDDVDERFGGFMNDIRLEADYLKKAPCP
jgi:hypothetical protein